MQILPPSVRIVDRTSDCIQAIFCRHLGPNWVAHLGLLVSLKKPPICQVFVRDLDRTSVPMGPICTQDGSDLSANFLDFVRIGIGVGPHFRYELVRVRIGDMLGFAREMRIFGDNRVQTTSLMDRFRQPPFVIPPHAINISRCATIKHANVPHFKRSFPTPVSDPWVVRT